MKRLKRAALAFLMGGAALIGGGAADAYDKTLPFTTERYIRVGESWKWDVPGVIYNSDNKNICELELIGYKLYAIRMTAPGDMVIAAFVPDGKERVNVFYHLFHITDGKDVAGLEYEEAETAVGTLVSMKKPGIVYEADPAESCVFLKTDDDRNALLLKEPGDVRVFIREREPAGVIGSILFHVVEKGAQDAGTPQAEFTSKKFLSAGNAGPAASDPAAFARRVLELCNAERAKKGLAALRPAADLADAAAVRASELPRAFSHTRPNGKDCFTAVRDHGHTMGENIAAGNATPESVVASWMESPGHRANILKPEFRELGVGFFDSGEGALRYYWGQLFRG